MNLTSPVPADEIERFVEARARASSRSHRLLTAKKGFAQQRQEWPLRHG